LTHASQNKPFVFNVNRWIFFVESEPFMKETKSQRSQDIIYVFPKTQPNDRRVHLPRSQNTPFFFNVNH